MDGQTLYNVILVYCTVLHVFTLYWSRAYVVHLTLVWTSTEAGIVEKAPLGFEPRISCLLDRRFNQLSHGAGGVIYFHISETRTVWIIFTIYLTK